MAIYGDISTGVSSSYFGITKDGEIYNIVELTPRRTISFTVYVSFVGFSMDEVAINGRATTRVYVTAKG